MPITITFAPAFFERYDEHPEGYIFRGMLDEYDQPWPFEEWEEQIRKSGENAIKERHLSIPADGKPHSIEFDVKVRRGHYRDPNDSEMIPEPWVEVNRMNASVVRSPFSPNRFLFTYINQIDWFEI